MRARLIAAVAALVAAVGVVGWGIASVHSGPKTPLGSVPSQISGLKTGEIPTSSATPVSSPSAVTVPDLTAGMRRVFHQTFTTRLDSSKWATCYPWAAGQPGCTNFSNPEHEWYLPSQVKVAGGALHLIASPQATAGTTKSGQPQQYACRSGMVTSYPGLKFEYGYVSMVARIPNRTGLWPGLWLAAANLKWPPEIDLLERWGPPLNKAGVYFHPVNGPLGISHLSPSLLTTLATGWHTISVSWTSKEIAWYVDNYRLMTVRTHIPHQRMYLIADLANFTKTGGCKGQLLIKSVDLWQK